MKLTSHIIRPIGNECVCNLPSRSTSAADTGVSSVGERGKQHTISTKTSTILIFVLAALGISSEYSNCHYHMTSCLPFIASGTDESAALKPPMQYP